MTRFRDSIHIDDKQNGEQGMVQQHTHRKQAQLCGKNADTAIALGIHGENNPNPPTAVPTKFTALFLIS